MNQKAAPCQNAKLAESLALNLEETDDQNQKSELDRRQQETRPILTLGGFSDAIGFRPHRRRRSTRVRWLNVQSRHQILGPSRAAIFRTTVSTTLVLRPVP